MARVSGIFGSHPILGNVARQDSAEREIIPLYCPLAALNFFGSWDQIGESLPTKLLKRLVYKELRRHRGPALYQFEPMSHFFMALGKLFGSNGGHCNGG